MSDEPFVPEDFTIPDGLTAGEFRLAPLGPQHNESDYAAWTSSIDRIRATPGFDERSWPREMSLDDNLRDLEQHAADFAGCRGFTYTVLGDAGDVIGCVYIYPPGGRSQTAPEAGERPSGPGCAPTAPRSTRSCTTRSSRGWNATGRSTPSSTPREPEPHRPSGPRAGGCLRCPLTGGRLMKAPEQIRAAPRSSGDLRTAQVHEGRPSRSPPMNRNHEDVAHGAVLCRAFDRSRDRYGATLPGPDPSELSTAEKYAQRRLPGFLELLSRANFGHF